MYVYRLLIELDKVIQSELYVRNNVIQQERKLLSHFMLYILLVLIVNLIICCLWLQRSRI